MILDTRLASLISTNQAPSTREAVEILRLVAKNQTMISDLDADITEAQAMLDKFIERKNSKLQRIQEYRRVLSPIRRVPPELWIKIFNFCRLSRKTPPGRHNYYVAPSVKDVPLVLCQVCNTWRALTLTTPLLWKDIVYDGLRESSGYTDMQKTWINRAGVSMLLSVSLRSINDYRSLDFLVPYIPRIRSLITRDPNALRALSEGTFDSLECLEIQYLSHWPGVGPITTFRHAPRLQRVCLQSCGVLVNLHALQLPWSQLTHLYFLGGSLSMIWVFLPQCPSLTFLALGGHLTNSNLSSVVTLPNLKFLTLEAYNSTVEGVLEHLILPGAVTDLEIRGCEQGLDRLGGIYTTWQFRSSFHLRRLVLVNIFISVDEFISMIRDIPSLRELGSCGAVKLTSRLFEALTIKPDKASLVLKLEELILEDRKRRKPHPSDEGENYTNQDVWRMVCSRWELDERSYASGRVRLKMFSLRAPWRMSLGEEADDQLKVFEMQGLKLVSNAE